jgi:hypothetical protein
MIVDKYATHLPLLFACAIHADGLVVEAGMGNYSTPMLHVACMATGSRLLSLDSNATWAHDFDQYESESHNIVWSETIIQDIEGSLSLGAALVFIDGRTDERAGVLAAALRWQVPLIVCHDTQSLAYGYEDLLDEFRYRYDDKRLPPWTTVVSNVDDLSWLGEGLA